MNPEENKTQSNPAPAPSTSSGGDNSTLMGVLSYIGVLVIIPLLMVKDRPFVKFHIKQGLALFSLEIIVWIFSEMMSGLAGLFGIVNLVLFVFSIFGIVNVVKGREKEVPLVGGLSKFFDSVVK